CMQHKGNPLTF
nr:immunoglobulin light chain junction region [Macaca mulatta]